jgi:hypothetical protein
VDVREAHLDEDLIVRYLLGELPETQQVEIEDSAFQNQQHMQDILSVESDLIDEYVRGEIPRNHRERFEKHFLAAPERRRKVEFARALAAVTSETRPETAQNVTRFESPAPRNTFWAFLSGLRPVPALSMAAASLAVIIGAAWLITESLRVRSQLNQLRANQQSQDAQRRELEQQIAGERARNQDLTAQLERERNAESERAAQREAEKQTNPVSANTIPSLILMPGLARGGSSQAKLTISPSVRSVRMSVGVEQQDSYSSFRVELLNPKGQKIWSQDKLSMHKTRAGGAIVLNLPAKILDGGRYELSLEGTNVSGASEDIGYYYFDVLRK